MEILEILQDWTAYINTKPSVVRHNCELILHQLYIRYGPGSFFQLFGIGYSGAQLLSAMQMVNQLTDNGQHLTLFSTIFRKDNEHGSSLSEGASSDLCVIVDDDICSGSALENISHKMSYKNINRDRVEVVVGKLYRTSHENYVKIRILMFFPNCKLWIR